MIQRQLNLNTQVDELLDSYEAIYDEMQNEIDDEILFKFNSVNLIIGKRGSGKTHMVMRAAATQQALCCYACSFRALRLIHRSNTKIIKRYYYIY